MERKPATPKDLDFLYKRCRPMTNSQVSRWLRVPEFVDEIRRVKSEKANLEELVEASDILAIMKDVFEELSKKHTIEDLGKVLPARMARNSINRLERAISENSQKS